MFDFYFKFSASGAALGVLILILAALAFVMPVEYSFENHFIENLEVFILFMGFCLSVFKTAERMFEPPAKFYFASALIYLLMIGRELSWGRVFYPIGVRENGEAVYISIHNLWYGDFMYMFNALLIAVVIFCMGRFIYQSSRANIVWRIPLWEAAVFAVMAVLSQCVFERGLIPYLQDYSQMLEETAETLAYISLVMCTYKIYFVKRYISIKYFDMI